MWTRKRLVRNIDFTLLGLVVLIMVVGLVIIGSATQAQKGNTHYITMQGIWILLGLSAILIVLTIDYTEFYRLSYLLYVLNLLMLLAVLLISEPIQGSQRWLVFGPVRIQPSEIAKIFVILTLAAHLARKRELKSWFDLVPAFIHVSLPMLLILRQPDLGTAMVLLGILMGMLFIAGFPLRRLALLVFGGLALAVGSIWAHLRFGLWLPLKDYQIDRLLVFIDPEGVNPLTTGYHLRQSKIAIGSGGALGKGLFQGTQNNLNFLPEQHTDFIFSVVGEELGFVGACAILLVYLLILWRGMVIAASAKDRYGMLVAAGVVTMIAFQVFVNVGMTVGIMPITGLPLPFVSYGGSSLLTNAIGIGLLLNIYLRRHKIRF